VTGCLIVGCGDLGGAIAERLLARGISPVYGQRRDPDGALPAGVLRAPATDAAERVVIPDGVRDVVCCVSPGSLGRSPEGYRRTYVDVPDAIVAAGRALARVESKPLHRFVLVSSTGVYGADDGSDVDESTPPEPTSWRGEILFEGERAALAAEGGVFERVCILRCAGIYGPGRTRLLEAARSGQPGDPARITNRVHRDDAAAAAVELLAADDEALAAFGPRRAVFVAVDDEPVDDWTVRAWLAARLGAPEPPRARSAPEGSWTGKRCANGRLRGIGWTPRYPSFRDGYAALLASG
jgi:nucleoside-diphosphate-sugar epimerase